MCGVLPVFVSSFNSGTEAIIELLNSKGSVSVLVPQNLCPNVIRALIENGFLVTLAAVESHDRPPNYRRYLSEDRGIDAVLFVHPYGVYDNSVAGLTDGLGREVFVVEDCCLCDPVSLLSSSSMRDSSWYVFSFGYSKVIDLEGGGLVIGPEALPSATKIERSVSRFGSTVTLTTDHQTWSDLESFLVSDFFSRLRSLHGQIQAHAQLNRHRLDQILGDKAVIRSPWRYVYFAEEVSRIESLRQRIQRSDMDLFFGVNYPLWLLNDDGILAHDHNWISDIGIPVNLFTDFRVTEEQVARVAEFAEDLVLCA